MRLLDRLLGWVGLDFDIDLHNKPFHQITPQLYLGARPRPEEVDALKDAGVTDVVSCLPEFDREAMGFLAADFRARFIPIHDGMHEDITAVFPVFFDALSQVYPNGRLLVHCQVGVSRSATLAIAHVMKTQHLRFYEAFCEVRSRRPQVLPNIGFASQLQRFERLMHPPRSADELASLTRYLHEVCKVPISPFVLQNALEENDFGASVAVRAIFGGDIPRVLHGVRRSPSGSICRLNVLANF